MFEKSDALLASMAMRNNHAFGLLSEEKRVIELERMSRIYDMMQKGLDDKEIAEELRWSDVTVSQVRQEVMGKGFFSPNNACQ